MHEHESIFLCQIWPGKMDLLIRKTNSGTQKEETINRVFYRKAVYFVASLLVNNFIKKKKKEIQPVSRQIAAEIPSDSQLLTPGRKAFPFSLQMQCLLTKTLMPAGVRKSSWASNLVETWQFMPCVLPESCLCWTCLGNKCSFCLS